MEHYTTWNTYTLVVPLAQLMGLTPTVDGTDTYRVGGGGGHTLNWREETGGGGAPSLSDSSSGISKRGKRRGYDTEKILNGGPA